MKPPRSKLWNPNDSVIDVYVPFCDAGLAGSTMDHLVHATDLFLQRVEGDRSPH